MESVKLAFFTSNNQVKNSLAKRFLRRFQFQGGFKMQRSKRVLRYVLVLLLLMVCVMLSLGAVHPSFAQHATAATVTASDFYVPSGFDPWGTTFDSSGNVWLAVPGCDPSPTCSTSTPPGKIEVYSPSSSSWTQTLQLPSGYAQALFLALDKSGRLWFPAPMRMPLKCTTRPTTPSTNGKSRHPMLSHGMS